MEKSPPLAPPTNGDYFLPTRLEPGRPPTPPTSGGSRRGWAIALALVMVAATTFVLTRGSGETGETPAGTGFELLDAIGTDGLPGVGDVTRVEAEANLTRATTTAQLVHAESGSYLAADPTGLAEREPGLTYTEDESTDTDVVSVAATDDRIVLAVWAGEATCALARGDTESFVRVTITSEAPCRASSAPPDAFASAPGAGAPPAPPAAPRVPGVPGVPSAPDVPVSPGDVVGLS